MAAALVAQYVAFALLLLCLRMGGAVRPKNKPRPIKSLSILPYQHAHHCHFLMFLQFYF
jgi:hypothetical protein